MKENTWTHRQGCTMGVNNALGSPRSWLNRAYDTHSRTLDLPAGSLHPHEITVAGIFPRHDLMRLPNTGTWHTLYRFFTVYSDQRLTGGHRVPMEMQTVIGMAIAVPHHEIVSARRTLLDHGATWIWWCGPGKVPSAKEENRQDLDHAEIYRLLDSGMQPLDIASRLNYKPESVKYVARKWENGVDINARHTRWHRPRVDHAAIQADLESGQFTKQQIADRHGITKATIYKIASDSGIRHRG